MSYKVQTVCGLLNGEDLGYTLTHEHFQLDFKHFYSTPPNELKPIFEDPKIKLETVGFLKQYPYSSLYNLTFHDQDTRDAVGSDLQYFKKFGGNSICENSCYGLNRDLKFMKKISENLGINVIAGTGHYVNGLQDSSTLNLSVEQMVEMYRKDLREGDEDGIKCGFIGEVGSVYPIHDFEKRAIEAAAIARNEFNCGVSFHPGRDHKAPFEIVRLYLEAGGKASKCIMSHVDRTIMDVDEILEFAKLGTYVQFDLFGSECSFYQLNPDVDMVSDAERINKVLRLIAEGYEERILLSHDIHTKHRLIPFGGHGFSHILTNVLPKLKYRGASQSSIDQITVKNPMTWLEGKWD